MFSQLNLVAFVTYLILAGVAYAESLYSKSSSVLQVDAKSYEKLVAKSKSVTVRRRTLNHSNFTVPVLTN